jgi:outer membrane protein OmpA-like peptidoglycan-associated protein
MSTTIRRFARRPISVWTAFALAAVSAQSFAQETKTTTQNGGSLSYVGGTTRIGIGVDSDRNARGEIAQVFGETDTSSWVGEAYGGRDGLGLKLSYGWVNGDWKTTTSDKLAVTRVFGAIDQNRDDDRRLTVGVGRDWQNIFGSVYVARALSSRRDAGDVSRAVVETVNGTDNGAPFTQDITTTTRTRTFARAYEWGVGARVGHFYENALLRLSTGVDLDFGKNSARQSGLSFTAEKFFQSSPFSIALSVDGTRKSGGSDTKRSDTHGLVMFRWDLGGNAYRPTRQTRTVQVPRTITETVTDPSPPPTPAAPASATTNAAATQFKTERVQKTVSRELLTVENFGFGSARLGPEQIASLKQFAQQAKTSTCPLKIDVQGHACPYGNEKGNAVAANGRAKSVRDLLIAEGIPAESITAVGMGGKNPAFPTKDARNRRAEVQLVGGVCSTVTEEVKTPIATPTPPPPPTPQPTTRTVTRTVMESKQEDVPVEPAWLRRALHTTPTHKQTVDTYSSSETSVTRANGPRVAVNRCPTLTDDTADAVAATARTISVLANDSDPDGSSLTLQSVSAPANGTAAISGSNVIYTPRAGFSGTDSFAYTATDGTCARTATVRVNVSTPAAAPTCNPDTFFVAGLIPTPGISVLANDVTTAPPLRIVSVTQPDLAGSSVSIDSNGTTLTFRPPGPFPRTSFTYTARDAAGGTCTGNVTLIDP